MYTIWTNDPYMMEEDERREMLATWADIMDPEGSPEDWNLWDICEWWNGYDRLDEMQMEAGPIPGTIVCLGSLGLWSGRVHGYKIIRNDAGDIFKPEDDGYWAWKVDDTGQVVATWAHHDGTNCYDYYIVPGEKMEALDLDDDDLDDLLYDGETWDGRKIDPRTLLEPLTGEMLWGTR